MDVMYIFSNFTEVFILPIFENLVLNIIEAVFFSNNYYHINIE